MNTYAEGKQHFQLMAWLPSNRKLSHCARLVCSSFIESIMSEVFCTAFSRSSAFVWVNFKSCFQKLIIAFNSNTILIADDKKSLSKLQQDCANVIDSAKWWQSVQPKKKKKKKSTEQKMKRNCVHFVNKQDGGISQK